MASANSEGFPRQHRIVRSSDYRTIYAAGRKVHSARFVLFGRNNGLEHHRLGITVSRKVGNAVVRNRIKRLFREIFRRFATELPNNFDFIVNAKSGCVDASYSELRVEFTAAARKICRL